MVNISYSSELLKNYKQVELLDPSQKFEALQTSKGNALLFMLSDDKKFWLVRETLQHMTGWEKVDLSSAQIAKDFPGNAQAVCATFDVAQDVEDYTISLSMVVHDQTSDHLYLCLGSSNDDISWTNAPAWVSYPFDAENQTGPVKILSVSLNETSDNRQYIVVDISRDLSGNTHLVSRYYIDADRSGGHAWHPLSLTFQLETDKYSSCLGRQKDEGIDGIYTFGQVTGTTQFIYQPLFDIDDPRVLPSPTPLKLPNNMAPDALATCRNDDLSTDLFVTANSTLFYFPSDKQSRTDNAVLLIQNPILQGIRKLFVFKQDHKTIVWGLNAADEVFYTSCADDRLLDSNSWRYPVPIVSNVEQLSPYINYANNANVFFVASNGKLTKEIQSPTSTIWKSQMITLPAEVSQTAQKFSSYTTRLQVSDEKGQFLANTSVQLSASTRTPCYIHDLYHVLDTEPVEVYTDAMGSITIVEWVTGLHCATLTATISNGPTLDIDPMKVPFGKATSLNTTAGLRQATIKSADGSASRPLVDATVSDNLLATVAANNQTLTSVYNGIVSSASGATAMVMPANPAISLAQSTEVVIGDLFHWLKTGVEYVIHLIEDVAQTVWTFVAEIAGKVYHAVLDTAEKVVGAVEWLYNQIKTGIDDLISYLEYLFEWADIRRTKDVFKKLFNVYLQEQVDSIGTIKTTFDNAIDEVIKVIDQWSGLGDLTNIGALASQPSTPAQSNQVLSAPSTLLMHHFQSNQSNIQSLGNPNGAAPDASDSTLLSIIEGKDNILGSIKTELEALANDFSKLSPAEIIKRLVGIFATSVLEEVKSVTDAFIDVLVKIMSFAVKLLDAPIYIPVISDILSDIFRALGIPDFSLSLIDVFCWIAAVPATIGTKLICKVAPFPDNDQTKLLLNANSMADVRQLLIPDSASSQSSASRPAMGFAAPNTQPLSNIPNKSDNSAGAAPSSPRAILGFAGMIDPTSQISPNNSDNRSSWSRPTTVSLSTYGRFESGLSAQFEREFTTPGGIIFNLPMATIPVRNTGDYNPTSYTSAATSQRIGTIWGLSIGSILFKLLNGFATYIEVESIPEIQNNVLLPEPAKSWSKVSTVSGIIAAIFDGWLDYFYNPESAFQNEAVKILNTATKAFRVATKVYFFFKADTPNKPSSKAFVDTLLLAPAIFCTGWHIRELIDSKASAHAVMAGYMGELGSILSYISRIIYNKAYFTAGGTVWISNDSHELSQKSVALISPDEALVYGTAILLLDIGSSITDLLKAFYLAT